MDNHSENNRSLSLVTEGAKLAPTAPERVRGLPIGSTEARRERFLVNIARDAWQATGLKQDDLADILGIARRAFSKQLSANEPGREPRLSDMLAASSTYAIALIEGVLGARAKLYPNETRYMLVPVAPAVIADDEQTLKLNATRENADVISALCDPTKTDAQRAAELRESIEADTRLVAFYEAKCA